MQLRALPFLETMTAIGVRHKSKLLIVFNQFIDEALLALILHVVLSGAVVAAAIFQPANFPGLDWIVAVLSKDGFEG